MLVLFPRLKYNLLESNSFKGASFLAGWQHSKSSSQAWLNRTFESFRQTMTFFIDNITKVKSVAVARISSYLFKALPVTPWTIWIISPLWTGFGGYSIARDSLKYEWSSHQPKRKNIHLESPPKEYYIGNKTARQWDLTKKSNQILSCNYITQYF